MSKLGKIKTDNLLQNIRMPLGVAAGYYAGNYIVNSVFDRAVQISGIEGFLGAETVNAGKKILKSLVPTAVGLIAYDMVEDEDAKNFCVGVSFSGAKNILDSVFEKNVPKETMAKMRAINGNEDVQLMALPTTSQMIEDIDRYVQSNVNGVREEEGFEDLDGYDYDEDDLNSWEDDDDDLNGWDDDDDDLNGWQGTKKLKERSLI